jgi:hypothetical protein
VREQCSVNALASVTAQPNVDSSLNGLLFTKGTELSQAELRIHAGLVDRQGLGNYTGNEDLSASPKLMGQTRRFAKSGECARYSREQNP